MGNERDEPAEVPLVPEGLSTARGCLTIDEESTGEVLRIELNVDGGDDTDTVVYAMEPELIAQTFVEYLKDGVVEGDLRRAHVCRVWRDGALRRLRAPR